MSVLRIIRNAKTKGSIRPGQKLLDEPAEKDARKSQPCSPQPQSLWVYRLVFLLVALGACWGLFVSVNMWLSPLLHDQTAELAQQQESLLQFVAIDSQGHRLAGVSVYEDKTLVGMTNTYGEWTRPIHESDQNTLRMMFRKRSENRLEVGAFFVDVGKLKASKQWISLDSKQRLRKIYVKLKKHQPSLPPMAQESHQLPQTRQVQLKPLPLAHPKLGQVGSLSFQAALPSRHDLSTAERLSNRFLNALRRHIDRTDGITEAEESSWQLSFQFVLPERAAKPLVRILSLDPQRKHRYSFMFRFHGIQQALEKTMAALKKHSGVTYSIAQSQDHQQWLIHHPYDQEHFFALQPGEVIQNSKGQRFTVQWPTEDTPSHSLSFGPIDFAPCPKGGLSCRVQRVFPSEKPPFPRWKAQTLKLGLASSRDLSVYVSGIEALAIGSGMWQYWGVPGKKHFLTIVRRGQLVYRGRLIASQPPLYSKRNQAPAIQEGRRPY